MVNKTYPGSVRILVFGIFVYIMLFAYLIYPMIIGPLGWSEKQTVTELGGQPEILIDDNEGAFVFWMDNVLTPNRTIEGAKLQDNKIGAKKVIFQGYEDLPIYSFLVTGDNAGTGFIFIQSKYVSESSLIIIDLSTLSVTHTFSIKTELYLEIEEIYPGNGRIFITTKSNQIVSILPNGSFNIEAEMRDQDIIRIAESKNNELFVISVNRTSKSYSDYKYYLKRFDVSGELVRSIEFDNAANPDEMYLFDNGHVLFLNTIYGEFFLSHYEYTLLDENFNEIKSDKLKNTNFHNPSVLSGGFVDDASKFKGRVTQDHFVFAFASMDDEIFVNIYDYDLNLILSRKNHVEFSDDIDISMGIDKTEDIDIVYLDSIIKIKGPSYSDSIAGKIIYFSNVDYNYQSLFLYLFAVAVLYLLISITIFNFYKKQVNKRDKLPDLEIDEKKSGNEKKLKEIRKKFEDSKNNNDRGKLLFGLEYPCKFRKRAGCAIIAIILLLTFFSIYSIFFIANNSDILRYFFVLIFAPTFGLQIGLSLLFAEIPTPRIFENGIEFSGAPIQRFNKSRFYWFCDVKEIRFRKPRFNVIRHSFFDFLKLNRIRKLQVPYKEGLKFNFAFAIFVFKDPDNIVETNNDKSEYVILDSFSKIFSGLKNALKNYLFELGKFEPLPTIKPDKKFWKKSKRRLYFTPGIVGIFSLVLSIILLLILYVLFPDVLYLAEWFHASNSFGLHITNNFALIIWIFFNICILLIMPILLILRYFTVKKILNLNANGISIPSEIKGKVIQYIDKLAVIDLSHQKGMTQYFSSYKSVKKGYNVAKVLYFGIILLVFIILFPNSFGILDYGSEKTLGYDNPYTTNLYGLPTSNQFYIIVDTSFKDETLYLEDNITISRGATLTMENMTIIFMQNKNDNYYSSRNNIVIFTSKSSSLILKNCIIKTSCSPYDNHIRVQGVLKVQNCSFEHLESLISVKSGTLDISNSQFNNCDNVLRIYTSKSNIRSTEFRSSAEPIEIIDSEVRITNCSFSSPYYYSDYYRQNGILIEKQDYWAAGKDIIIEDSEISGFQDGITILNKNLDLPNNIVLKNNIINNCIVGLRITERLSEFENNQFLNCSVGIKVDFQISTNLFLDQNHFSKNEVIIEEYYDLKINCYNLQKSAETAYFEIIDNQGNIQRSVESLYFKSGYDTASDYAQEEIQILKQRIDQDGSVYEPFPYSIYVLTVSQGCGFSNLSSPLDEVNVNLNDNFDLRVESLNFRYGYENRFFQLGYRCLGQKLSDVKISVTIENDTIETWYVGTCEPIKTYYIKFYIKNITLETIVGSLTFNLESGENTNDILPNNNLVKKEILFVNGDHTLLNTISDYDIVYLKKGVMSVSNQNIILNLSDKQIYWLIDENGSLEIENSTIQISTNPYGEFPYGMRLECHGDFLLKNSTISGFSSMEFKDCKINISNSSIKNSRLQLENSNYLFSNSKMNNTSEWGNEFYIMYSNGYINNCYFYRISIRMSGSENDRDFEFDFYINNSILENSYGSFYSSNFSIENTKLIRTTIEITDTHAYINKIEIIESIVVFYGSDWDIYVTNSKIVDNSHFYLIDINNCSFYNLTISNCNYGIYLESTAPISENLTFSNNTYDLYVVGQESIDWAENISNTSMLATYDITLNFTDSNGAPVLISDEMHYLRINVTSSNDESTYFRNISLKYEGQIKPQTFRLNVYEKDINGSSQYFDKYKLNLQIFDKYENVIYQKIEEIDPLDIIENQMLKIIIDF